MLKLTRLGTIQTSALQMYVFDPIFDEPVFDDDEPFPGSLEGSTLLITDATKAALALTEAANSADCDGDAEFRNALTGLAGRAWALLSAK